MVGVRVGEPVEVSNDVAAELGEADAVSSNIDVSNNVDEKVGADVVAENVGANVVAEKVGDSVEATGGGVVGDGDTGIWVGSPVVAITGDLVGGGGILLRFANLDFGILVILAFLEDPLGDAVVTVGILDGVGAFVALSLFGRSFLDGASFFLGVEFFVDPPMALGTLELPMLLGEAVAMLLGEAVAIVILLGEVLGEAFVILLGEIVAGITVPLPFPLPLPMPIPILPVVGEEVGDG
jgi:hypothetical protein